MDTADILFVAADHREFTGALRFWDDVRPIALPVHWARSATRKGRPIIAVANGAGWERARLASVSVAHAQLCNIGFCGALDGALRIADIVVSSEHLPVRTKAAHLTGRIASAAEIVATVAAKQRLRAQGYLAVEMEARGIPQPFYCIKAVSDLAGETFANDFTAVLRPDGRISTGRLLAQAARRPLTRFPELIRLAQRTAAASEKLGEFLHACDF
jgi:hypothetical protein